MYTEILRDPWISINPSETLTNSKVIQIFAHVKRIQKFQEQNLKKKKKPNIAIKFPLILIHKFINFWRNSGGGKKKPLKEK